MGLSLGGGAARSLCALMLALDSSVLATSLSAKEGEKELEDLARDSDGDETERRFGLGTRNLSVPIERRETDFTIGSRASPSACGSVGPWRPREEVGATECAAALRSGFCHGGENWKEPSARFAEKGDRAKGEDNDKAATDGSADAGATLKWDFPGRGSTGSALGDKPSGEAPDASEKSGGVSWKRSETLWSRGRETAR